jgi:GNAT superfamily N-acetyltransferase
MDIRRVSADEAAGLAPNLAALLQDAVHSGASVGFLPPLSDDEAMRYWQDVCLALRGPYRRLLIATVDRVVAGAVQLNLESRPNGSHRAEVAKLLVHSAYRRRGIGRALMEAVEAEARAAGRTTLVLDTLEGAPSEQMYYGLGYTKAGIIPAYARVADGSLQATVVMYKLLK